MPHTEPVTGATSVHDPIGAFLPRFTELEQAHRSLSVTLVRRIEDEAFRDAAERLGTATPDSLVSRAHLEWPVLLDFALYHHRTRGKSAVDRLVLENLRLSPAQALVLDAMARAELVVLRIERVFANGGLRARSVFGERAWWVVDPTLAERFRAGQSIVTRLVDVGPFALTTSMALPFHDASERALREALQPQDVADRTDPDEFARLALRFALAAIP